jgi:hypothetical protein
MEPTNREYPATIGSLFAVWRLPSLGVAGRELMVATISESEAWKVANDHEQLDRWSGRPAVYTVEERRV